MGTKIFGWKHTHEAVIVLVSFVLYLVGIKFLLLPVAIWLNARYVPMPRVMSSWFSKLFGGLLISAVLLQLAATFQFLLFPHSNFVAMSALYLVLQVALWKVIPVQAPATWRDLHLFDRKDAAALVVVLLFLLPFVPPLVRDPVGTVTQIGGLQAIDSTNHYAGIAEVTDAEHLTYAPNYYYPKGFHIATGFIENTVFPSQFSLGWGGNVALFFAQYMVLASMLAYAVYYFALALLPLIKFKLETLSSHFLLAVTLGIPLSVFYLLPMVNEGFLNYYYVITTILVGFMYLADIREERSGDKDDWRKLIEKEELRWGLVAFLLLGYGAGMSWPLLIPPLVVTAALFVISPKLQIWGAIKALFSRAGWLILLAFALQLIPIYFQIHFASGDGSQGGLNSTGGLKEYHPFVLLAGSVIVMGYVWSQKASDNFKRFLMTVYLPLLLFVLALVAIQYFKVAEVRYYAIKCSLLAEIVMLALATAGLLDLHKRRGPSGALYAWMLPAVPVAAMLLLVSTTPNPFRDIRELLRPYSKEAKPAFFDNDATQYIQLGREGKVQHFNSTSLHYNAEQGKFSTHSQLAFWANMMQYDATHADLQSLNCDGKLYGNIAFGNFTDAEQQALIAKVKECAQMARDRHQTYYIVTDKASAPKLQETFGSIATYVY